MFERMLPIRFDQCWFAPAPGDEIFEAIRHGQPFERRELSFIESFLLPGQTFWDIGAHFGLYTILAAKRVSSKGFVLAVEPDPKNRRRLWTNILLNRQWQVDILPVALGEREERTEFSSCSQGAYSGLRVAEVPGTIKKITVQKTALDAIAAERGWPHVDLVKIDVEGAELLVLRGGKQFFRNFPRPIIVCEFSDRRSVAFGYKCSEVYAWLAACNYRWFAFDANGNLIEQLPKETYDYENLVGCPFEKIKCLSAWVD